MRIIRYIYLSALTLILFCCSASASIFYLEQFAGGLNGWGIKDVDAGVDVYGVIESPADPSVGGVSEALRIDGTPPAGGGEDDIIYVSNAGSHLNRTVSFDFYSLDAAPSGLDLYFLGNGIVWLYSFGSPPGATDWSTSYSTVLSGPGGGWYRWDSGTEDASTFNLSAANITEIGIQVSYNLAPGGEYYGLDNFMISGQIPEPEEWALLGFAMISLCITFRKRLNDQLTLALAKIRR